MKVLKPLSRFYGSFTLFISVIAPLGAVEIVLKNKFLFFIWIFVVISYFVVFLSRMFLIRESPVVVSKTRDLSIEEQEKIKLDLIRSGNPGLKLAISILIFLFSLLGFALGFSLPDDFKLSVLAAIVAWVFLLSTLISLGFLIYFAYKADRKRDLQKDLRDGITRIEGELYHHGIKIRGDNLSSIRMGRFDFPYEKEQVKKVWGDFVDGERYFIEFSAGTKEIFSIGKII